MARQTHTATIAASASLSDAIDLGEQYRLSAILVPSTWTAANISIAGSVHPTTIPTNVDGSLRSTLTYVPVTDAAGAEVTLTAAADKLISLAGGVLEGVRYIKLRSGTSAAPVVQAAARTIQLVVTEV